jgi:hypothetical protein
VAITEIEDVNFGDFTGIKGGKTMHAIPQPPIKPNDKWLYGVTSP